MRKEGREKRKELAGNNLEHLSYSTAMTNIDRRVCGRKESVVCVCIKKLVETC